ncbi:MAG: hypothetical protein K2J70_05295 [Muribaculaceae bacterium]|nr:hypothetical protein [Muribaculaceae bacterium]
MGEIERGKPLSGEGAEVMYVVVLYGQRLEDCNAYRTLLHDRERVFVFDNSPNPSVPAGLREGWRYESHPDNPGLSAAYNRAAEYAMEEGLGWLVITDQDTTYPEGAGEEYGRLPGKYPEEKVFIPKVEIPGGKYLSPVAKRGFMTALADRPLHGRIDLKDAAIINSGLMVELDSFFLCGGYNDKVFLDFSDFQFIDRLSKVVERGRVTEMLLRQSFSAKVDSPEAQMRRFGMFCRSLSGYEREGAGQRVGLLLTVWKRAVALGLANRSARPLAIALRNYRF